MQYNIVRVDGQKSVYVAVQKQGGDTNTIAVVNGIRERDQEPARYSRAAQTHVVFDQSVFVKQAISTVLREGGIGIFLTGMMILIFLGSFRATVAVFLVHSDFRDDYLFHSAQRGQVDQQPWCSAAWRWPFPG